MSIWQRLWWALVGWKTDGRVLAMPEHIAVPVPGGVLGGREQAHLSGSVDLCVDLLSAHFQPSFPNRYPDHDSVILVGGVNPRPYRDLDFGRGLDAGIFDGARGVVGTSDYTAPVDATGKVDILLSAAAWYAHEHGIGPESFSDLCETAWQDATEMGPG